MYDGLLCITFHQDYTSSLTRVVLVRILLYASIVFNKQQQHHDDRVYRYKRMSLFNYYCREFLFLVTCHVIIRNDNKKKTYSPNIYSLHPTIVVTCNE